LVSSTQRFIRLFLEFLDGLFWQARPMKNIRLLLLLGVGILIVLVARDFLDSRKTRANVNVGEFATIPSELSSQSSRWSWSQSSGSDRKVEIFAKSVRQTKETFLLELEGVELKIFDENAQSYDQVLSDRAEFDSKSETLYSEGEVVLALGLSLQDQGSAGKSPTRIRSSGVTFESRTGICRTERYTEYEFEGGTGHSVGAFYDSIHRYLRMESEAYMERPPAAPGRPMLQIWAGQLFYDENAQRIDLKGGVRLHQGPREVQSTEAGIYLEGGAVRRIEATEARGADRHQERDIRFGAQSLTLLYDERRLLEKALGNGSAELDSASPSSQIHTRGERIDLSYITPPGASESVLQSADVRERARVEVTPLASGGGQTGDIRSVTAEWIHLTMRQGGQEIDRLETLTPGTLEITPRAPSRWKRLLVSKRMTARYGPGNRMEKLQALGNVETENIPPTAPKGGGNNSRQAEPLLTWSANFEAEFNTQGEATRIKQWENFRFRQGDRKGSGGEAEFDLATNRVELRGQAQVTEPDGSVRGQTISLDDAAGTLEAIGRVSSSHGDTNAGTHGKSGNAGPQKENEAASGLFSSNQPVYATADQLTSDQRTGVIDYRGRARLWQGTNRIEAGHIVIERHAKKLSATEGVQSLFRAKGDSASDQASLDPDSPQRGLAKQGLTKQGLTKQVPSQHGSSAPPIAVSADSMRYDEESRTALYTGRVTLLRGGLTVHSDEIEALIEPGGDLESSQGTIKTALARGKVRILEKFVSTGAQRKGFGEEAAYDPRIERLVLTGTPASVKSENGSETRGARLTYHVAGDRLVVLGDDAGRAYSYKPDRRPSSSP